MKYREMVKFLNDNGILLLQPLIADTVDVLLPIGANVSDDEFEEICEKIFDDYLDNPDLDKGLDIIWSLTEDELARRGYRDDDKYTPSAERGDYSPSNPWDAPGMSIKDFIR